MKALGLAVNLVLYQGAWFACVLGAATGRPVIGFAAVAVVLLWHLRSAAAPARELPLLGIAMVAGALFESLLVWSGFVRMPQGLLFAGITPLWMVALWAAFATTLNVALRPLRDRHLLAALLAAVGAPLAYAAGARLGALQWVEVVPAVALIAAGWGLLLPLLLRWSRRFDGFAPS